jgi:hypothetical protein
LEDEVISSLLLMIIRESAGEFGEVHLVCLLADTENITFEEESQDEKWRKAMDGEMNAIDKNET